MDGTAFVLAHQTLWGPPDGDEVWRSLDGLLRQSWQHPHGALDGRPRKAGDALRGENQHSYKMGHEGIVSKSRDLPYRSRRVRSWITVKNPTSPAALRILEEGTW